MRAEHVNPFLQALSNTFETMLGCHVERQPPRLKQGLAPLHEVSGIIGLSGNAVGTVVVSVSLEVALQAASTMLMTECTELNSDVIDAVGELTNMVAGNAKAKLEEYHLSISLPNVITGSNYELRFPSNVAPICIPFTCPWGPLALEVGLSPVEQPAGV